MNFFYKILATDGASRRGRMFTPRGIIETPTFMPVGTCAAVKSLITDDLETLNVDIILSNTYHLMLRPGMQYFNKNNKIHNFMKWTKPILTDSGGFQVYSLSILNKTNNMHSLIKISENGVRFKSFINGHDFNVTPETIINMQNNIGSDILMPLDYCISSDSNKVEVKLAAERTTRWLDRSIASHENNNAKLFGIIHGGIYDDLRIIHAEDICSRDLFGFAIGGLSIGEKKKYMWKLCNIVANIIPHNKPRYLMGVGSPEDLLKGIFYGIDMFDCVLPTRNARNGTLYTSKGTIYMKHSVYKYDNKTLDDVCTCYVCLNFSRSYLHHLFKANEIIFSRLASFHNIHYYMSLVKLARKAIENGIFYSMMLNLY